MNKIKTWIKEHYMLIIICLLMTLIFKGCKSCSSERKYEYTKAKYNYTIDSMQLVIESKIYDNKLLNDTINNLRHENSLLKDVIIDVKKDKEYYRKQNRNLANVAENLSKKDTIK